MDASSLSSGYGGATTPYVSYILRTFGLDERGDSAKQAGTIPPGQAVEICTKREDDRFFLTLSEFIWAYAVAGQGTYSKVYQAKRWPLNGEDTTSCVIKVSRDAFREQAELLQELTPHSKRSREIDHFIRSRRGYPAIHGGEEAPSHFLLQNV